MSAGDEARATVSVAVAPEEAFRLFTQEVNLWWRRGRRFRNAPGASGDAGIVCIEPGVGGRLFESFDTPDGERVVEMGRTLAWEPPHRLLLQWRASNFAPHEHTEVEVLFKPVGRSTHVTVLHRGWAAIRPDHPVRHGQPVPAFLRLMGLWWGDLLTALRQRAAGVPMAAPPEHKDS
jgi:uncharacterized protein YndB with AHSA1/START domain